MTLGPQIGGRRAGPVARFGGALGRVGGAIAWAAAAAAGAALALFFAATMVVIGLLGFVVLMLVLAAHRARRTVRAPSDPDIIEARNVGGHSWVAYGWDGRR